VAATAGLSVVAETGLDHLYLHTYTTNTTKANNSVFSNICNSFFDVSKPNNLAHVHI